MKRKSIITLIATVTIIGLIGCSSKTDDAEPVSSQTVEEEIEEDSAPIEEEPEPEPVEEEEAEEDKDKPLDLDSLANLKWVMDGLINFLYDYNDLCSGEEYPIMHFLWSMNYYSVDYPNLPKGELIGIDGEGYVRFTIEQAQEVMYSLTGCQVNISSFGENGVLEWPTVVLFEIDTVCKNWNTEYIGNNTWKVYVDKYRYGIEYDEDTLYKESEFTFTVIENPDSIFDGYSIIEVEEAKMSLEWAKAYYDYLLEKSQQPYYNSEDYKCSFIYADSDDIPELYVQEGIWYSLLYYSDGQVKERSLSSNGNYHIPKSGLFMEEYYEYGNISTTVSQLINGEFTDIAEGEARLIEEYEVESLMYDYTFNGEPVSEEEYNRRLNEIFDTSKAIEPWRNEGEALNFILDRLSSLY